MKKLICLFFAVVILLPASLFIEPSDKEFKKSAELPIALAPKAIANHVVISEVFYDETGTDYNEFVEFYNPTNSAVSIANWNLKHYNQAGNLQWTRTFPAGASISSHGFYLVGQKSPLNSADWGGTAIIPDNLTAGSLQQGPDDYVLLENATGTYIDGARWGHIDANNPPLIADTPSNTSVAPMVTGDSIERRPGETNPTGGNGVDTDNNYNDFLQRATPQPQNTTSAAETPTEGPPPAGYVVINEVLYNSLYPEPAGEFIELYNGNNTTAFCIDGWNISDGEGNWQIPNPTGGNDYVIQPNAHVIIANDGNRFFLNHNFYPDFEKSGSTPAVDLSLWESLSFSNSGDEVILNNSAGKVIDVVVWENGIYGSVVPYNASESDGESIQRNPEGYEGTETTDGTSPTGHNEATENMSSGVFTKGTPTPKSADVNATTISSVAVDARSTIAIIRWNTTDGSWPEVNPCATTEVVYAPNANPDSTTNSTASDLTYVAAHEIMLINLIPSTAYYFYVESTDGLGKAAVDKNGSNYYRFTTTPPDYNAPVLTSGPTASVSNTSVIIKWTTDEDSTSAVFYGTTTDLTYASSNLILTKNHEVALSDLQPSTSYYYEIRFEDTSENIMVANNSSAYYTFTTGTTLALNYYWGNFHSHTSYSDGTGTPADAYNYAKNTAGINILAITDHSGSLTTTEYNDIKAQASAYTQNGTFVGIAGQEWGSLTQHGHLNAFDASTNCSVATDDLSGFYSWAVGENAISGFNHPGYGTNFNGFNYTATGDASVESLELVNGKRNGTYEDDYINALSLGWKIGAFGDQDNHEADWGNKVSSGGYIYLTGIMTPYLNKTNVLGAIRSHMVYALQVNSTWPQDKIQLWFSCNGYRMGSELNASTELKFNITVSAPTKNFTTLYLYEDGKEIDSVSINAKQYVWTPTVSLSKGRHYYFAKVVQEDGDTAWSSPIWASKPVTVIPDEVPTISNVTHNALKINWTDKITVTAKVTDDKALSKAFVWYSVGGAAYTRISMADDGKTNGDVLPNDKIYTAEIPAQANGSSVKYYIAGIDSSGQSKSSPSSAPAYFYSYFVGAHVVINEVYSDAPGNETAEFIELYNPTGSAVSLANWTIQDEYQGSYADKFAFPTGASISSGGFVVIARAAGTSTWGYLSTQNFSASGNPTYEYGYSSALDNPSIPNLVSISADSEIKLDNSYDALHLCNAYDTLVDQIEYGSEGIDVPGTYAPAPDESKSISRNYNGYDSNDCIVDFGILATPSPFSRNNLPPKVWDVKHTAPKAGDATTVSVKIHDEALWTTELWYSINAGAYTKLTLSSSGENLYSAQISAQTNGTFVSYYIRVNDTEPQTTYSPEGAPTLNYTYFVGSHIVINEIYVNPPTVYDGAEFIELYNPTDQWVNVSGWRLQDEPWDYGDIGEFPSSLNKTNIPPMGFIVVAKDAGDPVNDNDGFYQEFGFTPDFELYDGDRTYEFDNLSVPNLINVTNNATQDNQIRLDNYPYGDAVYLINQAGKVVDCVEYHTTLNANNTKNHVSGLVALAPWEGESLTRDVLGTDTDDCSRDFFTAPPTPKANSSKTYLYFERGWNSICIPITNSTYSNARALGKAIPGCKWVEKWNATTQSFDVYNVKSWDAGFELESGTGYLVYVESSTGLQIYGKALTSKEVSLGAKWNSIGPVKKDIKASALAASIGTNCTAVAKWNASSGKFITHGVGTGISDFTLTRGDSCLVYLIASTVWTNQLS